MKKARIFLGVTAFFLVVNFLLAYKVSNYNLNNLYLTTTGIFSANGATLQLKYATLGPYRTFQTVPTQLSVHPTFPLYLDVTLATTTIGGSFVTYSVPYGLSWNLPIYADEDQ
ncbi:hypothetical protein [Chitinophaga sp.]|uniref:hypothetical protein n=1 Tax=Chitinophaga sp. TaxID=1869181 RepID=UPI0031E10C78